MRNFWIFLLALFLVSWEIGGALWFEKKYYRPNTGVSEVLPQKIEVSARLTPKLKNLNIYYTPGSSHFFSSSYLTLYFDQLRIYLNRNPGKKAYIQSFTDNEEINGEWIGLNRAAALDSFLLASGFRKDQLSIHELTVSERPGRSLNLKPYRVEVRIKE